MEEEINTNKELEDNLGKDAEIEPIIENIENEYDIKNSITTINKSDKAIE